MRSLDVRTVLIVALIVVSTGHVGRLFADREDVRQAFVGYVFAVCLDGVLAVSLYEAANVRKRSRKVFALCVFMLACAVSAGFNVAYYRQNYPSDPLIVSVLLGAAAPILAALVSVLKSLDNNERSERTASEQEAERLAELERYRIAQAEETRRVQVSERERTKREREKAQVEKARLDAIAQANAQASEQGNGRLTPGELDALAQGVIAQQPDIGPRPLARQLGCSPSTAVGLLRRLRG